jgi:membrane-bound lytic murein transglycosylase D
MRLWTLGIPLLCGLLAVGCGGAGKGNVVKEEAVPQDTETVSNAPETEESLTEELSAKRLEELYAKSGIPGWDPGLEAELKKWEHQVAFDVPIQMNRQVRAYLVYFSTDRKETFCLYLSRSARYLPLIKEIFEEYGLPDDLAYLAMIESGFSPRAYSHAHACGIWQFIKGTGLRYGLAVDSYVDERRDPEKSTRAAAHYLLDLYKQFGSWYLAAASYNCGEARVQRELNQSNHKNFWDLSKNQCLPNETKNYVPQMIAATIIAKNPGKFGFKNIPYLPPLAYDRVQVKEPTSLKAASAAVNVPVDEIQALNPELTRGITPPDAAFYSLNLPPRSKEQFAQNIVIARLEYPAVASRTIRVAKSKGRHGASRGSSRSAAATHKAKRRAIAAAKRHKTKPIQVATAKNASPRGTAPHEASMVTYPGAGDKDKSPQNLRPGDDKSKGKNRVPKKGGKKRASVRLAKKAEPPKNGSRVKAISRNSSNQDGSKDKVSQKKGKSLLLSEAR